ncbi:hypothetical protein J6590_058544 [Homalodisca vitripennis]|nr:hypothetical protein J6590_058544 [Homalodisca vitripennis]
MSCQCVNVTITVDTSILYILIMYWTFLEHNNALKGLQYDITPNNTVLFALAKTQSQMYDLYFRRTLAGRKSLVDPSASFVRNLLVVCSTTQQHQVGLLSHLLDRWRINIKTDKSTTVCSDSRRLLPHKLIS